MYGACEGAAVGVITETLAASPYVYLTDDKTVLVPIEDVHSILVQKTHVTIYFRSGRPSFQLQLDWPSDAKTFMRTLRVHVFTREIVRGRSRRKP